MSTQNTDSKLNAGEAVRSSDLLGDFGIPGYVKDSVRWCDRTQEEAGQHLAAIDKHLLEFPPKHTYRLVGLTHEGQRELTHRMALRGKLANPQRIVLTN